MLGDPRGRAVRPRACRNPPGDRNWGRTLPFSSQCTNRAARQGPESAETAPSVPGGGPLSGKSPARRPAEPFINFEKAYTTAKKVATEVVFCHLAGPGRRNPRAHRPSRRFPDEAFGRTAGTPRPATVRAYNVPANIRFAFRRIRTRARQDRHTSKDAGGRHGQ